MIRNNILRTIYRGFCTTTRNSSSQLNIEKLEAESALENTDFIDEEAQLREQEIEQKRNKSRLRSQHRNLLYEQNPYPEPMSSHHGTLKYIRRTFGRYGQASGINPSICWPTKQELDDAKDYERVKYPFTINQMIAEAAQKKKEKEARVQARQEEIVKKMQKLEGWKRDLYERIARKENEANAAKARKERLVEEVKKHFGYTIDPKDERFKEMLEKKEKEQKKSMKEARRKAKEDKLVEKLLKKKNEPPVNAEEGDKEK